MPFSDVLRIRSQHAARFVNSHRLFFYSLVSLIAISAVITNALKNYSNFYSVAIYLSKSSRSVLVLANFGVLLTLLCGHIVQRIFFGSLRPNEIERLYDRLWFFITESLLAFTIFRDEFDTPFAMMFGFLLFVKSFHWLASDRIEWMDQRPYPGPPLLFHVRMVVLFMVLWATDSLMFLFAVEHTLSFGVGGMVLFASEYGILVASVINTILKYVLSTYDLRRAGRRGGENAPPWENKSMWVFYIELATDFLKLTTYLVFFTVIIAFYGVPLNIVRDVYVTARSFITRLRALHRYQTATRNMDERYPNATEAELNLMSDRTCIICREEMVPTGAQDPSAPTDGPNTTPKKLPCGHIFHFHCLRSWLERQQSCPTCRRNVLDETNTTPTGAGAQRANGGVPDQAQNGQAGPIPDPQANNPMGFINRLFAPPRLRNVNQAGQPPLNIQNQAQGDGRQPGIFINYQVQYQFPRRPEEENQRGNASEPVPVPAYPGFHGPAGEWHRWPSAEATPDLSTTQVPATPLSTSNDTSDGQPSSPQPEFETPREAAAQAALRRFGGLGEGVRPTPTSPRTQPLQPSPTSSTTGEQFKAATNNGPPPLIPILNFETAQLESLGTPTRNPLSLPRPVASTWQQNQYNTFPSTPLATLRTPEPHHQAAFKIPTAPSSPLPPTLTNEQLARLDVLTRESIDERLRILEGVSANVYRSIEDLMRLRSVLPPLPSSPMPTPAPKEPVVVQSKGKAKEQDASSTPSSSQPSGGNLPTQSTAEELLDM